MNDVASVCRPLLSLIPVLAQEDSNSSVIFWSICLLALVVVMFGAAVLLRKRLSPNEDFHGEGFTLSDLRQLHKAGKMSDEEFNRTKAILVAGLQRKTAKAPDPLSAVPNLRSDTPPFGSGRRGEREGGDQGDHQGDHGGDDSKR